MLSFKDLQEVVERCTEPGRSSLYRDLYGMAPGDPPLRIQSWDDWHALPFLTKDVLGTLPVRERIFIPVSDIDYLRVSSGTSGRPPVFCPRAAEKKMEYRLAFHDFKKPLLAFTTPMPIHWHENFLRAHGLPGTVIAFDPAHPSASIRLARIAGVDAISAFSHQIQAIGELMKLESINEDIRSIDLTGEPVSIALMSYITETFPNARLYVTYGASELDDPDGGVPCRPLTAAEPIARYHPKNTHYVELVDIDSGQPLEIGAGVEGDLVISSYPGEPSAIPMLRLRIGDTARIVESHCAKHGTWSFEVLGRTASDFVKVPGGLIRADELERVMRSYTGRVADSFTLHLYDHATTRGPRIKPVLEVEPLDKLDLDALADEVSQNLRVNSSLTWAQGVKEGRFEPLACRLLTHSAPAKKRRRIMRH